ncbi:MAG TPA: SprB repeat-containing protein, partial [Bacteroidia bacterium]|nr:SprB repeat-containing protein [Bacteroidia bacterium]
NVNDATGPTITVSSITNVSCNGGSNGAIALSVTGGAGGYKYKWSNGATTASISNLQAGPYLVTVTDAGGCVAVSTINVTEPAVLATNVVTSPAGCGASTGSAAVAVSGGTSPYTYLWNTGGTVYNLTNLAAGTYTINIIDKAGCVLTSLASVENATGPLVTLDSVIDMNCATKTLGQILITATGGTPPYSYLWSNSATTQNVTGLNAGNYAVTVTDAAGCKGTAGATINTALPTGATICMVTVNPKTNYNTLTWDSINPGKIQEYLIYRQTTTPGIYNVIGHSAGNSGTYIDTLSNAGKRSWWYEISELDSCGQSSPISAGILFKTIHLTATANTNGSVSLVWDNFEGATFQRYIIYRDSVPGVVSDSIASVDTNTFGYVDHPSFKTKWYYHIGIGGTFGCALVPKVSHQAMSINYNASKSNTGNITFSTTGIQTVSSVNSLNVYPNPTRGLFTMSLDLDKQQ